MVDLDAKTKFDGKAKLEAARPAERRDRADLKVNPATDKQIVFDVKTDPKTPVAAAQQPVVPLT